VEISAKMQLMVQREASSQQPTKYTVRIYFSTAHHPSALSFFQKLTYRVQELSTVSAS
jgi:hypothetical protein